MSGRFVIGITGASGMLYAERLLEVLTPKAEVTVIISKTAEKIAALEGATLGGFDAEYDAIDDLCAAVASGSFQYDGLVVVPCSMKTLGAVANGFSSNLITRVADVALKEKRTCIMMPREMPLSRIHLQNMLTLTDAGATMMMLCPGFYLRPKTIGDLADMVVGRVLDHLKVDHDLAVRWGEE